MAGEPAWTPKAEWPPGNDWGPDRLWFEYSVKDGQVSWTYVEWQVRDLREPIRLPAICHDCLTPIHTDDEITRADLPLRRTTVAWPHSDCGGMARLPTECMVLDVQADEWIDLYEAPRREGAVAAITLVELQRLSQAARAVQKDMPGARERLERLLAEAPVPVRRLGDLRPSTKQEWYVVAGMILSLVIALIPSLKAGDQVTREELVTVIDRLIRSQDPGDSPDDRKNDGVKSHDVGVDPGEMNGTGAHPQNPADSGEEGPDAGRPRD